MKRWSMVHPTWAFCRPVFTCRPAYIDRVFVTSSEGAAARYQETLGGWVWVTEGPRS